MDIAKASKLQQDSDQSVVEMLTDEIDTKTTRAKHVLTALHAAGVPMDLLTSEVLHDMGVNMRALILAVLDE